MLASTAFHPREAEVRCVSSPEQVLDLAAEGSSVWIAGAKALRTVDWRNGRMDDHVAVWPDASTAWVRVFGEPSRATERARPTTTTHQDRTWPWRDREGLLK
jgi:hypothetical protein